MAAAVVDVFVLAHCWILLFFRVSVCFGRVGDGVDVPREID